jgi:hypothetical protein
MPAKSRVKSNTKKTASKKSAKQKIEKKVLRKKTAAKKAAPKKNTAKKKTSVKKKSAAKKTQKKRTATRAKTVHKETLPLKPLMVEPGPPPAGIPSVEEPSQHEEAIGTVTHYYSHLGVAVVQINKGTLKAGDTIHITGHSTDITQQVESMEYEHQHVGQASAGQAVGLKIKDHAREHDIVYLVK